ncbi:MAG: non-heme iron oxygenase ferredoxin subunit [Acidimicrobiia bacterium]
MTRHRVAGVGDIAPGELKRVEIGAVALCLAHVDDGSFCAVADECTHEQVELSGGYLDGDEVECPMHGARFDVFTGEVCGLPANEPVQAYAVEVVGDDVMVEL